MSRTLQLCLAVAVIAGLIAAPAVAEAQVQGPTRAEYVAQADQICKASIKAQAKQLKPVLKDFETDEFEDEDFEDPKEAVEALRRLFKPFGRLFVIGARASRPTIDELATIPRPPADEATLDRWFASLVVDIKLSKRAGKALKRGRLKVAFKRIAILTSHAEETAEIVSGFGFVACSAEEEIPQTVQTFARSAQSGG